MTSRVRRRFIKYGGHLQGTRRDSLGSYPSIGPSTLCEHRCTDETHPGPPYKQGGPLLVTRKRVYYGETASFSVHFSGPPSTTYYWYDGSLIVKPAFPGVEPTAMPLSGWGAKGWNATFPLHPVYNMGVSLIELKDFPSMISHTMKAISGFRKIAFTSSPKVTLGQFARDVAKGPKYMADNYLNVTFGWVPFVQDILAAINYQENLTKKLRWLKGHNGKSVRRRKVLDFGGFSEAIPAMVAPGSTVHQSFASFLYGDNLSAVPQNFDRQKTYDRKIWYVAKYRYWIPELAKPFGASRALKAELYGLALDPSILYRVIPWTWLIDWFLNAGTVLQNIYFRARYHVVAEYAYVMCSESYCYSTPGGVRMNTGKYPASPGNNVWSGNPTWFGATSRVFYDFRQREVANPYGFGITFASLSAYQWSILAALGLSRTGKHSNPRT